MIAKTIKTRIKKYIPSSVLRTRLNGDQSNHALLTFDDGPDPEITPKVLDLLREYEAKAVFFIPGRRIERVPDLMPKIIAEGHLIGNHTFSHYNSLKQPPFLTYLKDIKKCQKMIMQVTGEPPLLFRPPLGITSLTTLIAPRFSGLKPVTWSLDVEDWKCKTTADVENAAEKLLNSITFGDIVLLHDDKPLVINLLEIILPVLCDRNFNLSPQIR